jgi:RNA polymerase sigma-70 factor (ECF subfamily)
MLGAWAEAEDVTQDALLRAWNARAELRDEAAVERWLFSIATNGCLNVLAGRRRRALPQLEGPPADDDSGLGETEAERWVTPAADAALFPDAAAPLEQRETVALAWIALVQRVPPRQRAALLLKDVLGWSAEDIARALELSVPAVNSALHRAREAVARTEPRADEPTPAALARFLRAWEQRDLDALVALFRHDVTLAMPPHAIWFQGVDALGRFFRSPRFSRFWQGVGRVVATRANGLPALAFFRWHEGALVPHSVMVVRFAGEQVAAMSVFIGAWNFAGFEIAPATEQFGAPRLS